MSPESCYWCESGRGCCALHEGQPGRHITDKFLQSVWSDTTIWTGTAC